MRKNMKKRAALLLAAMMTVSVTACGGIEILRCFGIESRVEIPGMIDDKLVISAAPYALDRKSTRLNSSH